eukprot:Blabericola_migrator_1__11603@NODE_6971_length_438_cov_6_749326_g4897_i0_p1_GENE_NODE_6971_length_438_cov_6_749326_g4897_i0NODE_6971_length_438_cov_6_749326_g4897_i0_p1_ORF_typecomplete_len106_score3_89_NODE_6971_length_438_cov_6_749326_g4897_i029319
MISAKMIFDRPYYVSLTDGKTIFLKFSPNGIQSLPAMMSLLPLLIKTSPKIDWKGLHDELPANFRGLCTISPVFVSKTARVRMRWELKNMRVSTFT